MGSCAIGKNSPILHNKIPCGLKNIVKQTQPFQTQPGEYQKGQRLGPYIIQGTTDRGTEPKFLAKKAWTDANTRELKSEISSSKDPKLAAMSKQKYFQKGLEFFKNNFHISSSIAEERLKNIDNDATASQLKDHLIDACKSLHYVKLDYDDPENSLEEDPENLKVSIPLSRALGPSIPFIGTIFKLIHKKSTEATRRSKNLGAIKEALSNDVYRTLGFEGQKLSLVQAQYKDGYTKLLLDSPEIHGPAGEKFSTLTKQIHQGIIKDNKLTVPENKEEKVGLVDFASKKIMALLLGDRDKIGFKGDNVGYIVSNKKAKIINLDPGKSLEDKPQGYLTQDDKPKRLPPNANFLERIKHFLEKKIFKFRFYLTGITDRMTHHNLRTDLSFVDSKGTLIDHLQGGYKNFSIFDDALLSEKMKGMRQIVDKWNGIEKLFDQYILQFSEEEQGKLTGLNFERELEETRERLRKRKEYFESVFAERLTLNDDQLDFLDNVEKLTSPTIDHVVSNNKKICFAHLHVLPNTRKEWHLLKTKQEDDTDLYTLSFKGKTPEETEEAANLLLAYFAHHGHLGHPKYPDLFSNINSSPESGIIIKMSSQKLKDFMTLLTEPHIVRYKNLCS